MGAQNFQLKSGEQTRWFAFGPKGTSPQTVTTTTNQTSQPLYKESPYSCFQATVQGTGAVTATVNFKVTNDDNTGRGYIFNGGSGPGTQITTTSGSATTSAPPGTFNSTHVGAVIYAAGVPTGTTVSSIVAAGAGVVMSANATASATVQADFFDTRWVATVLGTITLNGTTQTTDGFTTTSPWRYVQAIVSNVTGTSATVSVLMGV